MKTWIEKYRPITLEEIKAQDKAVEKIKQFTSGTSKKKAIILNGSPGVGKTSVVFALAHDTNSEIFELNASDFRNKTKLQERLKPAIEQNTLFKKSKIILIDEVDGISGSDRGGVPEIIRLIKDTKHTIICTANDAWTKKLNPLRKICELVELEDISPAETKGILKEILKKEGTELNNELLNKIAIDSKGDLRAAINDIQTAASMENPNEFIVTSRNKKTSIFNALKEVFQDKTKNEILQVYDSVDMPIDEIILWIEENIPKVYNGIELVKAYQKLGNVDLFKGRIYKQQYWRFLVYENIFLSYGISEAKTEGEKKGFFKYKRPGRILKIWLNNIKHAKRKTIAEKYSKETHVGTKRIMTEWNEIKNILKNPTIQKQLKLDTEEIDYVMKY